MVLACPPLLGASSMGMDAPAGTPGGPGLALIAAKALTAEIEGPGFVDRAVVLIRDGRIEAVGPAVDIALPADYAVQDLGPLWVMPGMIDLHSHVGGSRGINDMVYQTNPGLRVSATVVNDNSALQRAVASGVTTILYIPGSGTNMGGQGVLMKTAVARYENALVRNPGSLKIAQGDNPTRWGYGMGRLMMNYHLRHTIRRGLAYAAQWEAWQRGERKKPERDIQLDVFRDLKARSTQVSTHTQYYQLVMKTILMLAKEFDFDVYIDHGSFDSWLNADLAEHHGVAAILGPRSVMWPRAPRFDTDGQVQGSAWGFQREGHTRIGFNTDAPVIPQEELFLQAAMGVRYGMHNEAMQSVRGLTIVPALTAGIDGRVGSLEVGKDADVLVVTGDPGDPRNSVERVLIGGETVYDTSTDRRRW